MDRKILVIEDDQSALRFIGYTLEQEGYQVLTATNGLTGLRKAQSEAPDLIILDIMLPGIDGFEICHRLRAEPQTAQLPILMLSAKAQEIDKATGLNVGANDYLTKPADPSEIVSRVQTLLAPKASASSKMVSFLGAKGGVGTTTMMVNIAIALSQQGKRVIVVDLCPNGINVAEHLGLKPEHTITELVAKSVDTIDPRDIETALAVHHTGVRILARSRLSGGYDEIPPPDVDLLLERLGELTDYLLVDLPFPPSESGKVALTKCDLIIIVTDSKADGLASIKSTTALLGLSGIAQQRMGTVIVDQDVIFPEVELSKMKTTIELNTGVSLLEIIPFDTKASIEPASGSTPVILSNPDCPMAQSIRGVAEHIITQEEKCGLR